MVKAELKETIEKNENYMSLCKNVEAVIQNDNNELKDQIYELDRQLQEYENAHRVLSTKYEELGSQEKKWPKQVSNLRKSEDHSANTLIKEDSLNGSEISNKAPKKKLDVAKSMVKKEIVVKTAEQTQTLISELRRRIYEDVETKRTLQEIIKLREDTISKQKGTLESMQRRLETDKINIQSLQVLLNKKNAEVKTVAESISKVMQSLEKYKKPNKDKAKNPRYIVKQRLKKEAEPYLFGPVMHDDLD